MNDVQIFFLFFNSAYHLTLIFYKEWLLINFCFRFSIFAYIKSLCSSCTWFYWFGCLGLEMMWVGDSPMLRKFIFHFKEFRGVMMGRLRRSFSFIISIVFGRIWIITSIYRHTSDKDALAGEGAIIILSDSPLRYFDSDIANASFSCAFRVFVNGHYIWLWYLQQRYDASCDFAECPY